MKLITKGRSQTLAQVLMTFYYFVKQVNKHNKNKDQYLIVDDELMYNLKKELMHMCTNNEYMNTHIVDSILVINDRLNEYETFWLEDFICTIICNKNKTLFLTEEQWNNLYSILFNSNVKIITPFRNKQLKFDN